MPVTIGDIADRLGVSRTTVFRALNNKPRISEKTRRRVLNAADEMNYRINKLASGLRSKRSMAIGLIFNDLRAGHFYSEIFHGVESVASENGYSIILGCTEGDIEKEKKLIELLCDRQVDGILAAPTYGVDTDIYRYLKREKIPFVFIGEHIPHVDADLVSSDNVYGAYQAVDHLAESGHQKIAFLSGPEYPCTSIKERIKGYKDALKERGLSFEEVIQTEKRALEQKACGYRAMLNYLKNTGDRATAILATNDSLAIGAVKAIREMNLVMPDDIAVIGYNNDEITMYFNVPLTTVSQPKRELGEEAMRLLLKRINEEYAGDRFETVRLKPELIIRESSRR